MKLASALRRLGWKGFLAHAGRRGWRLLARPQSDIVLSKELAQRAEATAAHVLQTSAFEGGDPAVLDRVPPAWQADARNMELLRSYVRNGYRALFAEVDGTIVGHMWWVDRSVAGDQGHPHLLRYDVRLGPHEAWAFNFYLEPQYRGGGNATEFLFRFEEHLLSRGFQRVSGFVASDNKPARWLYSLCGWRPRKVVNSVRIAGCLLVSDTGVYMKNPLGRTPHARRYRRLAAGRRASGASPAARPRGWWRSRPRGRA